MSERCQTRITLTNDTGDDTEAAAKRIKFHTTANRNYLEYKIMLKPDEDKNDKFKAKRNMNSTTSTNATRRDKKGTHEKLKKRMPQ